jgi:hypothetical protein
MMYLFLNGHYTEKTFINIFRNNLFIRHRFGKGVQPTPVQTRFNAALCITLAGADLATLIYASLQL